MTLLITAEFKIVADLTSKHLKEIGTLSERFEQEFDKVQISVAHRKIDIRCLSDIEQTVNCEKANQILDIINEDKGGNIFFIENTQSIFPIRIDGYWKIMEDIANILVDDQEVSLENLMSQKVFDFKISNGTKETTLRLTCGELNPYEVGISISGTSTERYELQRQMRVLVEPLKQLMRKGINNEKLRN